MSIRKTSERAQTRLSIQNYAPKLWEALDTPVSLSCYLLFKNGEFAQLVNKDIDADHYDSPLHFALDLQAVKLLSKYPYLDTKIDRKKAAEKRFLEAEVMCRDTNERFRNGSYVVNQRVDRVLSGATRKIASILGDVPTFEMLDFAFGPGASFSTRGHTSVFNKVSSALECSTAFSQTLPDFLGEFPAWIGQEIVDVSLVSGSEMTMVPKNAKTDRSICIEPLLNGMYQKGFGSYIRDRLKSYGIDLTDQTVNQCLAQSAYTAGLATVDFSMASDTISHGLVLHLLPFDWFQALDVARSPLYLYEGEWRSFHKFSSMGNGYTFELESLIFYALAYATLQELGIQPKTGENVGVYGDDVIIPQDAFDLFSEVTEVCGFRVNNEKSFAKGAFFESCGADYFRGISVRPFQIKKKLNKLLPSFYAANSIKRAFTKLKTIATKGLERPYNHHQPVGYYEVAFWRDGASRFCFVFDWCVSCIPPRLRVVGPEGYGDGHLIGRKTDETSRHPSWDGWYFRTFVERSIAIAIDACPLGYALYFNRGRSTVVRPSTFKDWEAISSPPENGTRYTVRGRTEVLKTKVLCHFEWHNLEFSV